MLTPTETLRDEHRVILRALELLERATARPPAEAWWAETIAWLRTFADHNHHAKEETALFPAMVPTPVRVPSVIVNVAEPNPRARFPPVKSRVPPWSL